MSAESWAGLKADYWAVLQVDHLAAVMADHSDPAMERMMAAWRVVLLVLYLAADSGLNSVESLEKRRV